MKLIILGLDALNYQLIEKCKEEMPTLYNHLKNDTQGKLRTTIPYFTGPTWTSFQTGKNISNHGVANFFKYDPDLNPILISSKDIQEATFYEIAHQHHLKCFVMNLPYTYPAKIPGDLVFSWLHIYDNLEDLFQPKNLTERFSSLKQYQNRADRSKSVITYLKTGYDVLVSQEKVIQELLQKKEHDVYFFLLNAADMVQHKCFQQLMSNQNNQPTTLSKKILSRLDQLVAWIDQHKDPNTTILIASDHGFQTYQGKFFINGWLKNNHYLFTSSSGKQIKETINRRQKKRGNIDISRLVTFVKKHPKLFKFSEYFYDFFVRYCPFDLVKQQGIDFQKTKAFCRSTFEGSIFFNPNLTPTEKAQLKPQILQQLNQIPDLQAHDGDIFYPGKFRKELGDIIVTSEKYEIDSTITNQEFMHLNRDMHAMDGIFMAYGPDIKKQYTINNANIFDITPTLLHLLNLPVPSDMDGKVLTDIFSINSEPQTRTIQFSQTTSSTTSQTIPHNTSQNTTTTSEKDKLQQAIKNLQF